VAGTVAQALAATRDGAGGPVRVGNPSGVVQVAAEVAATPHGWWAESASLYRTARTLMRGEVAVSGAR
jgi:2-methylaconitate isomerase